MAHLLANDPGQQDAGEILLSGFTQMALQMEAQRRLMKPGSKPRRGKKGQKKQPQRGLGVAQLEKIRLEEQRRTSQHVQQLAALRQLHAGTPLYTHLNAPTRTLTPASIVLQFERDSNHDTHLIPVPSATSSALACIPSTDSIASSFLFKNASSLSSIPRPSTPATPLDLFPREKFAGTSSLKASDRIWTDTNSYLRQVPAAGERRRAPVENSRSLLSLACNQSNNEGQDDGGPSYPFSHIRRNITLSNASTVDLWHPSQAVPSRMASPSFGLERMMELSSFQSAMSSRGNQHTVTLKRQACAVVRPGGQLSELPMWMSPSFAHSKPSQEYESHGSSNVDVCELTLRPAGAAVPPSLNMGCQQQLRAQGPHSFLSLAVGATWQDSVAESAPCSSTPSPVSATTTKSSANDTSTDEYMSPPISSWSSLPNFFSMDNTQPKELQFSLFSSFDASLDLTLKL